MLKTYSRADVGDRVAGEYKGGCQINKSDLHAQAPGSAQVIGAYKIELHRFIEQLHFSQTGLLGEVLRAVLRIKGCGWVGTRCIHHHSGCLKSDTYKNRERRKVSSSNNIGNDSMPSQIDRLPVPDRGVHPERSEERRVGKECRSRWSAYHH